MAAGLDLDALAARFKVSRSTIKRRLQELRDRGVPTAPLAPPSRPAPGLPAGAVSRAELERLAGRTLERAMVHGDVPQAALQAARAILGTPPGDAPPPYVRPPRKTLIADLAQAVEATRESTDEAKPAPNVPPAFPGVSNDPPDLPN